MRPQFGPKKRDDHLPLIDLDDLGTERQNLIRDILMEEEGGNVFNVLTRLREEAKIGGTEPYLAVRPDEDDRSAVIVVRRFKPKDEVTTEITVTKSAAGKYPDPNDCEAAVEKLHIYAKEVLFRIHMKLDTPTVLFSTLIANYLAAIEPGGKRADKEEQERMAEERRSKQDPVALHQRDIHSSEKILAFVQQRRLGFLDEDFGHDFKAFMKNLYPDIADRTINRFLTFLRKALDWARRKYRPPFAFDFEGIDIETTEGTAIVWEEVQRILLHCLGYVWEAYGFATEWVQRDGEWVLQFRRHAQGHIDMLAPVIRYILIYWFTGTRAVANTKLGWRPLNRRGWIDVARQTISRNGRKSPNYFTKPQEKGGIVPCIAEMFGRWEAADAKAAEEHRWAMRLESSYVIHNGWGHAAKKVRGLAKAVFEAVGIDARRHDCKGGGATAMFEAGFTITNIAWFMGNQEKSIDEAYRDLKNSQEANLRRRVDPSTVTIKEIVDPLGRLPKVPRNDPPPPPGAVVRDADRFIRDELERAIDQVLHG